MTLHRRADHHESTPDSESNESSGQPMAPLPADGRAAARHWVWSILVQALTVISGVLIARHLGPERRGIVAKVMLWPMLVLNFGFLGIPQAFSLRWRRSPAEAPQLVTSSLRIGALLGVVEGVALALLLPEFLPGADASSVHIGQLFCLILPVAFCGWIAQTAFLAEGHIHSAGAFTLVQPVVTIVSLVLALTQGPLSTVGVLIAYLAARVAMSLVPLLFLVRLAPPNPFGKGAQGILRDGSGHFAESLTSSLVQQSEIILTSIWLTSTSLGLLAVWLSYVGIGVSPVASLTSILFLRLGDDGDRLSRYMAIARSFRAAVILLVLTSLGLAVASNWLLPAVFGPAFRPSAAEISLLCAIAAVRALCGLLTTSLRALGHSRFAIACHLVYLVAIAAASPILMRSQSLVGCLQATLLAAIAMLLALLAGMMKLGAPMAQFTMFSGSDLRAIWRSALAVAQPANRTVDFTNVPTRARA